MFNKFFLSTFKSVSGVLKCGKTAKVMITSKSKINSGVKSMAAKAMSWNQVCKSLSGIGGYVEIAKGEKVRPLELMQSLGVHVLKNSYTPKDILTAWSERMKKDGKVCIMRSVGYHVVIDGKEYTLCSEKDGAYKTVSQSVLVPLVSASDKADKTDVVVNATNVLRGLQQSVFITATMEKIQKSADKCAALKSGYVNMGTKQAEKWVRVAKLVNGSWAIATEEKKVATNAKAAAKGTKKSTAKKSTKKAA